MFFKISFIYKVSKNVNKRIDFISEQFFVTRYIKSHVRMSITHFKHFFY